LLLAGFAVVLAGSVVLLRFATRSDDATAGTGGGSAPQPAAPAPSEPAAVTPSAPADAWSQTVAIPQPSKPRSVGLPEIASQVALPTDDEGIEYDARGKPIPVANLGQIRKATVPTDNMIRQCIIDSGVKGLTGKAVLTFTVAKKRDNNGQEVVETESTGFEEEGTTIDNAALLECMHKTAFKMKFPPSKSPVAVWARRRINVENNELNENWVFEFGRIR
jgi:hypothetical protein